MSDTPRTDTLEARHRAAARGHPGTKFRTRVTNDEYGEMRDLARALERELADMTADYFRRHKEVGDYCERVLVLERDAEELANALRDALAGHPVRNADELIQRYSPLLVRAVVHSVKFPGDEYGVTEGHVQRDGQ